MFLAFLLLPAPPPQHLRQNRAHKRNSRIKNEVELREREGHKEGEVRERLRREGRRRWGRRVALSRHE